MNALNFKVMKPTSVEANATKKRMLKQVLNPSLVFPLELPPASQFWWFWKDYLLNACGFWVYRKMKGKLGKLFPSLAEWKGWTVWEIWRREGGLKNVLDALFFLFSCSRFCFVSNEEEDGLLWGCKSVRRRGLSGLTKAHSPGGVLKIAVFTPNLLN